MASVELALGIEIESAAMPVLIEDSMVWYLAKEILDGEIELDSMLPLITDRLEHDETCADIRTRYGVQQSTVEQAIEALKQQIQLGKMKRHGQ